MQNACTILWIIGFKRCTYQQAKEKTQKGQDKKREKEA